MELSEAIRKGSELRPQAFDWYFEGEGSCALGAAYEGIKGRQLSVNVGTFKEVCLKEFPVLALFVGACPVRPKCAEFKRAKGRGGVTVCGTIAHLNDDHKWTREQIADWVEQFETETV
jgi:hypothetical protein